MNELHVRAMKAAKNYLLCEKELLSLLIEMDEKHIFYQLGFVARKTGRVVNLEEVFEALLDTYLKKNDPIQRAKRTFLRKGTLRHQPSTSKLGRHSIPAKIRHEVNLRDENRCTYIDNLGNRCSNTIFIHFHHEKPVSEGGVNTVSNLKILCSAHHAMLHFRNSPFPKNINSFAAGKMGVS